ncbi:Hypothetical protein CINCED_3A024896 [Cinara cedri]|uniref:Phosphatidic acid phosphatase type 2/haloperoxidase domain-containing protein n=1 Tax=Cinara cedri TaxID=506608 RepID=A0A5E4NN74_9HEMI|nr:Hypothetical protein CINCED_3A024896 [Cinara cedri]
MDNIRDYINYLKDPELVANFQRFFGVIRHDAPEIGSMLENGEVITNSPVVEKENETLQLPGKWCLSGQSLCILFYLGQSIKDIIQWPRPACPPVVRLQTKWSIEFGMPSTHAMISIALPYSVLQFISDRYQIDYRIGIIVVFFWCMLITLSRLYLGMHTVLDVIAGLLLAIVLLIPFVPLADLTDRYLMYNKWTPLLLLIITVSLIIIYPTSDQWTPTKGDTTLILGTCAGILTGGWLMVTLEIQDHFHVINPMNNFIIWPSLYDIGVMVVRSGLGYLCIVMSFLIIKYILCFVDVILVKCGVKIIDDVLRRHIPLLDITYKYVTFYLVSFNLIFVVPILQKLLHVERLSFYHEAK